MIKVGDRVRIKNKEGIGTVLGFKEKASIHQLISVQMPKRVMNVRFSSIKGAK